jgi:O-methyltransferase involved in polyketide biosynthesis
MRCRRPCTGPELRKSSSSAPVQFLDAMTVAHVFRALHGVASRGSWIGVDLLSASTVASPFMAAQLEKVAELGWPRWEFAVDDPEAFLADHGWRAERVLVGTGPGIVRASLVEGWREVIE